MLYIQNNPKTTKREAMVPNHFQNMVQSFFNETGLPQTTDGFVPSADVIESKETFEIRLSLAGVKKADIKISVESDVLKVEGERKHELKNEGDRVIRKETDSGKFIRRFNIDKIDHSKIEAEMEDGILRLILPKAQEIKASEIQIK